MDLFGTSSHSGFLFSECSFVSQGKRDVLFSPWVNPVFSNQLYSGTFWYRKKSDPGLIKLSVLNAVKYPYTNNSIGYIPWNILTRCGFEQDFLIVSEMGLLFVGSWTIIYMVS